MKLYPEELQNDDGAIMQLTTEELRNLLAEKDREIAELKHQSGAPEDN